MLHQFEFPTHYNFLQALMPDNIPFTAQNMLFFAPFSVPDLYSAPSSWLQALLSRSDIHILQSDPLFLHQQIWKSYKIRPPYVKGRMVVMATV